MGMIDPARQLMTLLVFLGVVLSLLILRLIPGLLLRLVLAIPRRRLVAFMASTARGMKSRRIGIVLQRKSAEAPSDTQLVFQPSRSKGRVRRVLVSSSLLVIAGPGHHRILELALHRLDDAPALIQPNAVQRRSLVHRGSAFSWPSAIFLDSFLVQCNDRPTPGPSLRCSIRCACTL